MKLSKANIKLQVDHVYKAFAKDRRRSLRYAWRDILRDAIGKNERNKLRESEFWALQDISFQLPAGKSYGIIGKNGSGKTTLLSLLTGVLKPTKGSINWFTEKIVLIDQQSVLYPELTGRENVRNKLVSMGFSNKEIAELTPKVVEFSGVEAFLDTPLGKYSTGMRLRLIMSIYVHCNPDVLIIDEALEVGDFYFNEKFHRFLISYLDNGGTMIVVSHNMLRIRELCDYCIWIDQGKIMRKGEPSSVIAAYRKSQDYLEFDAKDEYGNMPIANDKSNKLYVKSLRFESTHESLKILPGAGVDFYFTIEAEEPLEDVGISLTILKGMNALCNLRHAPDFLSFDLEKGMNNIKCSVKELVLAPGVYSLRMGVFAKTAGKPVVMGVFGGRDHRPVFFEVEGFDKPEMQDAVDINMPIYMKSAWTQL